MYHKIQIKFDYRYGEIDICRSGIMALFLLEDRDFKGFWMNILYFMVYSIVLKFEKIWLSSTLNIIRKPKKSLFSKRKRAITGTVNVS
jgi:hypothetical protein